MEANWNSLFIDQFIFAYLRMGFEPMANHIGYRGLEEEMNNPTPIVPDSLIIEMDPVESENSLTSSQSPSTSQFQSIKLEGESNFGH